MKRIAIEEAFVTQAIADEWDKVLANGAVGEQGFKKMGEAILAPSPGTRIIHQRLTDWTDHPRTQINTIRQIGARLVVEEVE